MTDADLQPDTDSNFRQNEMSLSQSYRRGSQQ